MSAPLKLAPDQLEQVIHLAALGTPLREIASRYNVGLTTIHKYMNRPEFAERLAGLRALVKETILRRTAEGLMDGACDVAAAAVKDQDARSLDASTRAILNLEKATASASGEDKKMEVTGPGGQPIQVDARALMLQIIEHIEGGHAEP